MTAKVQDWLSKDGLLSAAWPSFQARPSQLEMAQKIESYLDHGGNVVLEAGTGTGKTLAYLIPAILSGKRVVVSTGTKNLQDQIARKDLPALQKFLNRPIRYTVMKGRDNYLCKTRWESFAEQPLLEIRQEAEHLEEIRDWAETTTTGDRAELDSLPDRLRLWRDINARADTCIGSRCSMFDSCFLTKMRRQAEQSQLMIVNHHLFFADLAVRSAYGSVLPDYEHVIFDEAHLVEEIATMYFGVRFAKGQFEDLARKAERFAGEGRKQKKGMGGAAPLREAVEQFSNVLLRHYQDRTGRFIFPAPDKGGVDLEVEFALICERLDGMRRAVREFDIPEEDYEAFLEQVEQSRAALEQILARDQLDYVYSVEIRENGGYFLTAAPIEVGPKLSEQLFPRLQTNVWTSATLTVKGSFDYFLGRVGLDPETTEQLSLQTPFDVQNQALLYLPQPMPAPNDANYFEQAVDEIESLLELSKGRAFLLFTSHAMMQRVFTALDDGGRWPLLIQGQGSKAGLIETFKELKGAVLLGTASFWHGVDVKGAALSLVIIDKLPFAVPNDPLVGARIARIRERGGNPFKDYQVPMAVLALKQGLGRLIRSEQDLGALAVLDSRLSSKAYGKDFIQSLPPYRRSSSQEDVARWFEMLSTHPTTSSIP